jgi:hypothetical protein
MKALVTGYPGTGKSSIAKSLKERGYDAYDIEAMPGYMHAVDSETGVKITLPSPVPRNWFENVGAYNWDSGRILRILDEHDDVYICALADNQKELYDSFDILFLLTLDEVDMESRLLSRMTTHYGKDQGELADILMNHRHFEDSLLNLGAHPINTKCALPEIVDEILTYARSL